MKVTIVQGAGVAGLVRTVEVDEDSLAPADAARLRELAAGVFGLPERIGAAAGGDAQAYAVTVRDGGRSHTVLAAEAALPAELRALVEWAGSVPGHEERLAPPG